MSNRTYEYLVPENLKHENFSSDDFKNIVTETFEGCVGIAHQPREDNTGTEKLWLSVDYNSPEPNHEDVKMLMAEYSTKEDAKL